MRALEANHLFSPQNYLRLLNLELADETYREDIEEWDSVADLNLFIELEDELEICFGINKSYNLKTEGQLIGFIDEKLVEQD